MEQFDGVVAASVIRENDTVWFVAGEYYGDNDLFAAYRYRVDTDDYEVLLSMSSYVACVGAVMGDRLITAALVNG